MGGDLKLISGSAHPELSQGIADYLEVAVTPSHVVRFSNENMLVQIDENVRNADVFVVQPSCAPVSDGLVELLITIDALRHASAERVTAVIPYFPYSRSDKKDRPRISITARLMSDLIQAAGAHRVLTMDLHAPQIQGFFRIPVDQLIAAPTLSKRIRERGSLENHVLIAGDIGEAKEVGRYANRLRLPVAIVDKRRHGDDEKPVATNMIGDVKGKVGLIVDDEVASAGTLVEAARFVLERGATAVEAVATHGILSGSAPQRIEDSPIRSLLLADTVPIPKEKRGSKIEVVLTAPLFGAAIRAIHRGESVSALFQ